MKCSSIIDRAFVMIRFQYGGPFSATLEMADIPVWSQERCRAAYVDVNPIQDSMFCAGAFAGGVDACGGDAGGPLVYQNQVVGIVSFGYQCGVPGFPSVYTSVSFVQPWILAQLES